MAVYLRSVLVSVACAATVGGIMERYMEWLEKHEWPVAAATYVAALILGPVFYCTAKNGGKLLDLVMIPITYLTPVMDWLCGC
jgi:hypothetical protein